MYCCGAAEAMTAGAGLTRLGWLPLDPLCALVVLVQGAMPTAQNLVLLLQVLPPCHGFVTRSFTGFPPSVRWQGRTILSAWS